TSISRDNLAAARSEVEALGAGGVSGAPLAQRSYEVLHLLNRHLQQASIISVGGVTTGDDVQQRLEAGATLVQGYTAFLYEGPFWRVELTPPWNSISLEIDPALPEGGATAYGAFVCLA